MTQPHRSGSDLLDRCRALGVDESHLDVVRTRRAADGFDANADRMLVVLADAAAGTLDWSAIETADVLVGPAERQALLDVLAQAAERDDDRSTASFLLRATLEERRTDDPEVVARLHDEMDRTLRSGLSAQSGVEHFDHDDARAALLGARDVFEQHGKRFFLDRGTLLGAVRDGGFIANDYDIDLGIFADELSLTDLKAMFEHTDYAVSQDESYKVGLMSAGIQIDFFSTTREGGHFRSEGFGGYHTWYFSPFDLVEYEFLDATFLVPDSYEKHLDENYGNWRRPAVFYDLSYNEPCVVHGRTASAVYYQVRRLRNALDRGDRYLARAAIEVLAHNYGYDFIDHVPQRPTATVAPRRESRRRVRPIVVADEFGEYSHRLRRAIESALSLSEDVDLLVLGGGADGLAVARAIDRVRNVLPMNDPADARHLIDSSVWAVVVPPSAVDLLDPPGTGAGHRGFDLVVFDEDDVALGSDDLGRIVARSGH